MARSYNVSFNITGTESGLLAALQNAARAMRGLGNAARAANASAKASQAGLQGLAISLNTLQRAAQQYKTLQDALKQTSTEFSKSTAAIEAAKAKYQADAQAVDQLRQKLAQLNTELGKARQKKIVQSDGVKVATADLQALKRAFDVAKQAGDTVKMTSLAAQINQTQAALLRQKQTAREAAQAFKELSDKVKQMKSDLKAAEQVAASSGQGLNSARSNAERLKASFQSQLAALNQLKASLSAAGFDVSRFAAEEARLQSEINRTNAALERQTALRNAQSRSAQASQEMFNAYNNFQNAINTAEQVAAPFKSAAENAMNFEYAMSKVKSLTQMRNIRAGNFEAVRAEMAALTEQAERLGATTEFTSQEVAEAMGFYGMAGWDTSRIQNAMQHTIDLATIAGDHNIQRMADVLSDDMTAMGLKAGEMITLQTGKQVESSKYFADAFAYALTNANVNRESLHEALKYNAPIAKQWGLTMGEEFAINMMSANAGIKGSMAGTGLRAGLLRISAPPKKAAKAFAEMGLSASDAQKELAEGQAAMQAYGVQIGDFATTLKSLSQVYNSLGKGERLGFVDAVFGKNASSFWANILDKGNVEDVLKAAAEIDSGWVEDYAKDTASVMRDNTKISLELLKSSFDALQRSIGQALLPTLRSAAEAFAPMVTAAGEWIAAHPGIVQAVAAIAAALAGLIVTAAAVKLAFAGFSFIAAQIALVRTALAALGSGAMLGGLMARLAALRAAMFGLGGAATIGGWSTMFGAIAAKATAAMVAIRGFFASLTLGSMASGIASGISAIATAIRGAAVAAMSFALSPVGVALMALALAGLYCYQNWDRVGPVLSNIAGIIGGALTSAISTVTAAISAVSSSGAFDGLIASAGTLATVVGGSLVKAFAVLLTVAASVIAIVIQLFGDAVKTVIDFGAGMADALGKFSQGDFSGAFDALDSTAEKTAGNIKQSFTHIFDGVVDGAHNVQSVLDALNMPKMPTQAAVARHRVVFDEGGVAHEAPKIDTSATQAALDAVGTSAQTAATNMDAVNTASQGIQQAGDAFAQLPAAVEPAATGLQQVTSTSQQLAAAETANGAALQANNTSLAANGASLQSNSAALQANIGSLQAFGAACDGAVGGVNSLGSAASSAAGSVSGLGAAAQSACAQLAAAGANAAASVNAAIASMPSGGGVAANAEGGIYRKGSFLTTFAEKSPEAAIPLDNSQRAKDLWTQVGQMLNLLPKTNDNKIAMTTAPPFNPNLKLPKSTPINSRGRREIPQMKRQPRIPNWAMVTTQTQPRYRDTLASWKINQRRPQPAMRMPLPVTSSPYIEEPQQNSGGLLGDLIGQIFSPPKTESAPVFNITMNITINGNADRESVRQGVEESLPQVKKSFADQWRELTRERARRSYA